MLTVRGNSSPIIVEDRIYASFDNGRLAVFEIDSGFPIWDGAISYVSGVSELENLILNIKKENMHGANITVPFKNVYYTSYR